MRGQRLDPASRRILRLALGTALAMWLSQAAGWSMSFIAPVLAMALLATPLPAPSLAGGAKFVLALSGSVYLGMFLILPFLEHQRWVGILLLVLALFFSFYYPARGGSPILGMFMTVGLTMVVTVGSVTVDGLLAVAEGVTYGAVSGMLFVWLAHAILPEPPPDPRLVGKRPVPPPVAEAEAIRSAVRSLTIVLPLTIWFLFSSASAGYVIVMIKVATMGQQAEVEKSKAMGASLILSTVIGGITAIIMWQVLSIWPSLLIYALMVALACLVIGPKILQGPGMHPKASTWSYGLLTALILIAPAVLDSAGGGTAGAGFYTRLVLIGFAALYGTIAAKVFDAFWAESRRRRDPRSATMRPMTQSQANASPILE